LIEKRYRSLTIRDGFRAGFYKIRPSNEIRHKSRYGKTVNSIRRPLERSSRRSRSKRVLRLL
jgi:hypothetical protein